jgi:hypothetical protein
VADRAGGVTIVLEPVADFALRQWLGRRWCYELVVQPGVMLVKTSVDRWNRARAPKFKLEQGTDVADNHQGLQITGSGRHWRIRGSSVLIRGARSGCAPIPRLLAPS